MVIEILHKFMRIFHLPLQLLLPVIADATMTSNINLMSQYVPGHKLCPVLQPEDDRVGSATHATQSGEEDIYDTDGMYLSCLFLARLWPYSWPVKQQVNPLLTSPLRPMLLG